jgi:hypothetical protein
MVNQTPDGFLFAFKVTDAITIKKFANLPRFGDQAGKPNENFLNAELFTKAFLGPCEPFRKNTGLLMFEFSRFWKCSPSLSMKRDCLMCVSQMVNSSTRLSL